MSDVRGGVAPWKPVLLTGASQVAGGVVLLVVGAAGQAGYWFDLGGAACIVGAVTAAVGVVWSWRGTTAGRRP